MAVGSGALSRNPKIDTRIALVRENCIRTGGVYSSAGVRGVKGSQPEEEKQKLELAAYAKKLGVAKPKVTRK